MAELFSFFIIMAGGLILSQAFRRLHLPYVTALIIAGVIVGPVLNLVQVDNTLTFIGAIGLVFLMFIAGSEIKLQSFSAIGKSTIILALVNGLVPFVVGTSIGLLFGFSIFTSLVLGTIFISSAIAVVLPSLEANNLIHTPVGKTIISATVLEDMVSLLLLAAILQSVNQTSFLPLPVFIVVMVVVIALLKKAVPALHDLFQHNKVGEGLFESDLRFVMSTLIATVIFFELLGVHSIIAGFVIGIILGDVISGKVEEKIRTVSYGIFIPTFFLIVGIETNLDLVASPGTLPITIAIVVGVLGAKIGSGFIAGRSLGMNFEDSILIGIASTPQLSTTLAAAFAALEFGLLNKEIIAGLVVVTIVTTFVAPLAIKEWVRRTDAARRPFLPWGD